MRVTILGSGTAVPEAERFPPGVLIAGGREKVVVDLGPGTLRRVAAAGVSPDQVTTVLVTHFHPHAWAGHDPMAEAAAGFPGRIELARDLLEFEFASPERGFVVRDEAART